MTSSPIVTRVSLAGFFAAILVVLSALGPASASEEPAVELPENRTIITVPTFGQMWGYVPMEVVHARGTEAILHNSDFAPHTVTARQVGPDGYPLFQSGRTEPGDTRTIAGVTDLPPGTYRFYCSVHTNMPGTLYVVDDSNDDTAASPGGEDDEPAVEAGDRTEVGVNTAVSMDDGPSVVDTGEDAALPSTGGGAALASLLLLALACTPSLHGPKNRPVT